MKVEYTFCPICEKIIKENDKHIEHIYGFSIGVHSSKGGWGYSEQLIYFKKEICDECFQAIIPECKKVIELIKKREGINKSEIVIIQNSKKRKCNPMSDMRENKPQQKRLGKSILRLLS